jgi:hypothetical protein
MLEILHSRQHNLSHYQIDLLVVGADMAELEVGGTLVSFAPGHIKVATAWDNDGLEPLVEIIITGYAALAADGIADVIPLASGYLDVGSLGVEVGNFITADLATVAVPSGRYAVTVFADKLEPITARRVHFHFRTAA